MNQTIKTRIEQIGRGEVPEGYKKTKAGLMPCSWKSEKTYKARDVFYSVTNKKHNGQFEVLSATQDRGVIPRSQVDIDIKYSEESISGYKKVDKGDFVISLRSFQGGIEYSEYEGLVSPAYTVLKNKLPICDGYYKAYFKTNDYINRLNKGTYGIRDGKQVGFEDFGDMVIHYPSLVEQERIAEILGMQDKLITLQEKKIVEIQEFKKICLRKMFPTKGERVPEWRFPEFTEPWEQRKFGETVLIERGGSPRPIDDYITNDADGLNWVKIGDAPEQGNYITKTAEKIKPSGLSKTREVHPNDLILSNSMSFGKPYIMAINGCIHDGWLLIRDTQEVFDLKFLCHLLGTTQMLSQYKAMAAGSTVNNLNKELVSNTNVMYPKKEEQAVVGKCFEVIDSLITLHQRKLEEMKKYKKALMQLLLTGIIRVS